MLRFNCMESILFDCPEYSVMTLSLPRTHIFSIDWPDPCLETLVSQLTLLSQQNVINMELIKFCIFDAKKGIHRRSSDWALRDAFEGI